MLGRFVPVGVQTQQRNFFWYVLGDRLFDFAFDKVDQVAWVIRLSHRRANLIQ